MAQLASTIRRFMWIVPVILGLVFIGAGAYMISEGFAGKDQVRSELVAEQITTTEDAAIPNAPVDSAATAKAQADVIKKHTLEATEGKTYAQMDREDPQRDFYLKSVTLRSALMQTYMGFRIADLVIGLGAFVVVLGVSNVFLLAPVLFWIREGAPMGAPEGSKSVTPTAGYPAPSGS